jgi:hypothetical protein
MTRIARFAKRALRRLIETASQNRCLDNTR